MTDIADKVQRRKGDPSSSDHVAGTTSWALGPLLWGAVILAGIFLVIAHKRGIEGLFYRWATWEEYSYGYLVPLISAFMIWQKKNRVALLELDGSWFGFVLLLFGILLLVFGELSTIPTLIQYGMIVSLFGTGLSYGGKKVMKELWVPIAFLLFMIPLPLFLYQGLSQKLQFISSELGVLVIRLAGISVYLEGNVIDLGSYKLQVVEACNGLRYLFPLASFSFLCAYFFRAPLWQRVLLFLSAVPITIIMNSFRIGMIGVLVEYFGESQAEGFLHQFEGWAIFMACLAILFAEIWILARLQRPPTTFSEAFYIAIPTKLRATENRRVRDVPVSFWASVGVLAVGALLSISVTDREEIIPNRADFFDFPMQVGEWNGIRDTIEQVYLDALKLTDYVMANYQRDALPGIVNYYVAYYASQRSGESAHSPRSCIPGGGWKIQNLEQVKLAGHRANRVEIVMGEHKQLVYYWFQQRGRFIINEYLVKWYLFWDSLTRNRSDGALVRLTTPVGPTEQWSDADQRIRDFALALDDRLTEYVPQ